ncbi:hypothetical protein HanPI659440_Chr16g0654551 [Helianthus annuus]|nr:hypothetical protein HanPI659440_Chr16g0654551 [Helianthus annuus]
MNSKRQQAHNQEFPHSICYPREYYFPLLKLRENLLRFYSIFYILYSIFYIL